MKQLFDFFKKMYHVFGLNMAMGFVIGGFVALLPFLREDFGLTRAEVGFFTTSLFGASLFTAVFAGNLIDRIGIRKSLFFGGLLMGGAAGLFSIAPHYYLVLFFALFMGLGECILTPAGNKAIMSWAGEGMNNTLLGVFRAGPGLGALVGATLLPALAMEWGWRPVSLIGPFFFILFSIIILFTGDFAVEEKSEKKKGSLKGEISTFLGDPHCRFALILGFSFAVVLSVVVTYLPLWLNEGPGLSLSMAGLGLGIARFGGVIGRPLWGYIADKTQSQENILLWEGTSVAAIVIIFALLGDSLPLFILMILALAIGFSGMGFEGVYFGFIGRIVGLERTGTMTGMALTFFRLAIMVIPPVFGFLADTTSSYTLSWLLVAIFPSIAVFYYLIAVREKKPLTCSSDS